MLISPQSSLCAAYCKQQNILLQVLSERADICHWPTQAPGTESKQQIGSWCNFPITHQRLQNRSEFHCNSFQRLYVGWKQGCKYNSQKEMWLWRTDHHLHHNKCVIKMAWNKYVLLFIIVPICNTNILILNQRHWFLKANNQPESVTEVQITSLWNKYT